MTLVTVYSKKDCFFCELAKKYLNAREIDHKIINETLYDKEDLFSRTGSRTFPKIFVKEKYIGGYEDLKSLHLYKATDHRILEIAGEVVEPMTVEETEFDRFILFDGEKEKEFNDVYMLYKKELASFWTVEELDTSDDMKHLEQSSEGEIHFLKLILCFFASLDEVVMENIGVNFMDEFKNPIVRLHLATQNFMEGIHSETYSILIQTYIRDSVEKKKIMKAAQTMPIINKKIKWVTKWMDPAHTSLAERILSLVALEGIQFSGAFAAIYFFKKQGKFPGLCFANSLIARDEGLHAEGGVMLYKHLKHTLPETRVHEIIGEAVSIEQEFIKEAIPVRLIGMNEELMAQYIEFVADFWLVKLGYSKLYKSENPFSFMELQGIEGKTNFFENRVTEYSKANILSDDVDTEFTTDTDF